MSARELSIAEARDRLGEVATLRTRTRRSLGAPWFPPVVFGALTVLSSPFVAAAGTVVLAPFWLVAGTLTMYAVARHYRRRARMRGVTGAGRRVGLVATAMAGACFAGGLAGGMLAGPGAGVLAPIGAVVAGYAVLGRMQHRAAPALGVAAGGAAALALQRAGGSPWGVELVFGAAVLATGAWLRRSEPRA
jgi:hypothetical protein